MDTSRKIKVVVVDDSAFMRKTISTILNQNDDIEVVATARDGLEGIRKVTECRPHVVTLDVEMPKLNGLEALGYIMSECPTPVVMLSAYTETGGEMTLKALEYGAVDFVCKPSGPISLNLGEVAGELVSKVHTASQVDVRRLEFIDIERLQGKITIPQAPHIGRHVVVIASSTGGPRALYEVVPKLPADLPAAVLLVQHMATGFTRSMAARLNQVCQIPVKEAEDNDEVLAGHAYLAPSNYHMVVVHEGDRELIRLHQGPSRNSVRPAADVTLESVAAVYGANCLAVVLTGMGRDGTQGAKQVKEHGGIILAQNEASCVVYGMPRSVYEAGVTDEVLALNQIARRIVANVQMMKAYPTHP